jgi:uncharacterized BrkB/YihY/UPF0761 family membrane protein
VAPDEHGASEVSSEVSPALPGPRSDDAGGADTRPGRVHRWVNARQAQAEAVLQRHRNRPLVDLALRIVERDREAAGTVVGSAVAFRLFLFFVPMLLFIVGIAGFLSSLITSDDVNEAGITGSVATQIETALEQRGSGRWIAAGIGLFGMASTGRTLSKALVQVSCLNWRLPVSKRAPVRVVGGVVGLIVGIGLVSVIINRVRQELGFGVMSVSFVVAFAVYALAWILMSMLLPRATSDPGALLPGAVLVGLTVTALQLVSQVYLPGRFERASELYGAIGVTIVVLGWFFILGRVIVLSMTVNATVYERFGSISQVVFGLPVLRTLPRRWPWFRRFFQLDHEPVEPSASPDA